MKEISLNLYVKKVAIMAVAEIQMKRCGWLFSL